jgi:hypothetical protein
MLIFTLKLLVFVDIFMREEAALKIGLPESRVQVSVRNNVLKYSLSLSLIFHFFFQASLIIHE